MVDETKDETSDNPASNHESPQNADEPESKRNKREWLTFHGTRRTRVGAEFQVTVLPTPGEAQVAAPSDEKEGKEESNGPRQVEETTDGNGGQDGSKETTGTESPPNIATDSEEGKGSTSKKE